MSNTCRGVGRSTTNALYKILLASTMYLPLGGCLGEIYRAERDRDTAFEVERRRQEFEIKRDSARSIAQASSLHPETSPGIPFYSCVVTKQGASTDVNGDGKITGLDLYANGKDTFSTSDPPYCLMFATKDPSGFRRLSGEVTYVETGQIIDRVVNSSSSTTNNICFVYDGSRNVHFLPGRYSVIWRTEGKPIMIRPFRVNSN